MKRFWDWLTFKDLPPRAARGGDKFETNARYTSRLDVSVNVTGDIDYVLRMLPIVAKQLEAADGRLTDAP